MADVSWLDRAIGFVNPARAAKREQAKLQLSAIRAFDMGSSGRRTSGWRSSSESSNSASRRDLLTMRNRCRALYNNSPHAKRGVNLITANTVGTGIVGTIAVQNKNKNRRNSLQRDWDLFVNSTNFSTCGKSTFGMLQKLAMKSIVRDGEVLARRVLRDGKLQIQLLEADYLYSYLEDYHTNQNGDRRVQGIRTDEFGRVVDYELYSEHPGEWGSTVASGKTVTVPASEVAHVFDADRAGGVRGVPWLHAVGSTLRDFGDYSDAELLRQKLAASQVAFVTDNNGGTIGAWEDKTGDALDVEWEPGSVNILPNGLDVKFNQPLGVNSFNEFRTGNLHDVATGLNIPYYMLSSDLSSVNFTSGRMGSVDFDRSIDGYVNLMLKPLLLDRVFGWWVEWMELRGMNMRGVSINWTAPRRQMIDPMKEIMATQQAVRAGLMSLPEAQRQLGNDPAVVITEIKESNDLLDELELIHDTDPRRVSAAGLTQARQLSGMGGSIVFPGDEPPEPVAMPNAENEPETDD